MCWGGPSIVPGPEWTKTGIIFNEPEKLHAFGLKALKGATKGFQLVLQAYLLKHLLFAGKSRHNARQVENIYSIMLVKFCRRHVAQGNTGGLKSRSSNERSVSV